MRPSYGYDAPGIMRGLLAAGTLLVLAGTTIWPLMPSAGMWGRVGAAILVIAGLVLLAPGLTMLIYARAGKMRMRDLMLNAVPWTGQETVLDVGTGAGLLLIGAAKRLSAGGRAIGIDVWSAKDLSNNRPAVTQHNIGIEGVADRAFVQTGDILTFAGEDESFDRVLSLLCLHNIEAKDDQALACRQIARLLKPGGIALIGDYVPTSGYAAAFARAGLTVVSSRTYFTTALGPMWMVRAEKPKGHT